MSKTAPQQAFPLYMGINKDRAEIQPGMTYRQWLAGMAMSGIVAGLEVEAHVDLHAPSIALSAVGCADAVIAKLNETPVD